jgi:hypothetical protein
MLCPLDVTSPVARSSLCPCVYLAGIDRLTQQQQQHQQVSGAGIDIP